ncbi:ABC transporter ATP-binding protein [Adlercreutzia sp. ZJ473]|uniref:ABC transporter ATP-binding protein n=1 Tax=Adlercreutzia sp. ZJ473 TaxID=2722822 RepID=UPI001551A551|nr:ABC transporter ATP-binding protein [Adlercreutzia sp. ZJ473]
MQHDESYQESSLKAPVSPSDDASEPSSKLGFAYLLGFAGRKRWLLYFGCALSAVAMLLSFGPYICIWLVARDLIAVAPDWTEAENLALHGWLALFLAVVSLVLYFFALLCTHACAFHTASNLRKACLSHLMKVQLGYFDTHASGALRRVIDGCAGSTEGLIAHKTPDTAGSLAMVLGLVVTLFVFDWRMGLACLMSAILSIACMFAMMGGKNAHFMQRYMQAQVNMSKAGTEYVRGIPVVKVFQQTVYSFKAFHDAIIEYSEMAEKYAVKTCAKPQVTALTVITGVAIFLVPVAIFLAPGAQAEGFAAFAGFIADFAFYAIFSAIIATAVTRLMFVMEEFEISSDAAKRTYDILNSPILAEPEHPETPFAYDIAFDHVSFRYEGADRDALSDVSFEVPQGATVALVGPSGGGKTTAASLVPRFWDVAAGSVRIGGIDVRAIDADELMQSIAFVFQDNRLFKKSIYENVAAARLDATREDVMSALAAAQCDDILAKLPNGVDTVVGTAGIHLSGGEKQRIALARAICKQAPIVVLDEATAFADPENEALIQKGFAELARGRTVLMIAHRLSTVVGADKIVVIDDGRAVEQGTHDELVAFGGLYARMWEEYQHAALWRIKSDAPARDGAAVVGEASALEGGAR